MGGTEGMSSTTFWNDWALAVNALKGKIDLTPDIRRRWKREIASYYLSAKQEEQQRVNSVRKTWAEKAEKDGVYNEYDE